MNSLKDFLRNDRFAAEAGVELKQITSHSATATMVVTQSHLNAGGVCQGGALFTMADLVFAAVANSCGQLTFSISSTIIFHHSAVVGDVLQAVAEETYNHHKLPCVSVKIVNQNQVLIASFEGIGYRKEKQLPIEPVI
jgi:acyl-CoA thioesterase